MLVFIQALFIHAHSGFELIECTVQLLNLAAYLQVNKSLSCTDKQSTCAWYLDEDFAQGKLSMLALSEIGCVEPLKFSHYIRPATVIY